MQRWFFANETEICEPPATDGSSSEGPTATRKKPVKDYRTWNFCVSANFELCENERFAVVGNCEPLGNWDFSKCVQMKRREGTKRWYLETDILCNADTFYRFLIIAVDPATERTIVRCWESHLEPRIIPVIASHNIGCRTFGLLDGLNKIDRGWLTSEIIVQMKLFNAPFIWKENIKNRLLHVKVTPVNLKIPTEDCKPCDATNDQIMSEDSMSNDTGDTLENTPDNYTAFAFNESTTLREFDCNLNYQPQFGTLCGPNDLVIVHLTIGDFENTAYLVDLYSYSRKAGNDEPPYHMGYHYVLPNLLKHSEGLFSVPITCAVKHRPLGMMQIGYLIIRPMPSPPMDMSVTYSRYWNPKWRGLDVGHRGSGTSFKTQENPTRENTIYSLKYAVEHGADLVEFDVQLSKDLVPVVYHDFMVYVSLQSKGDSNDYLALPMRELKLEQLKNLKVFHTIEAKLREQRCFRDDDLIEHQPFPTLAEVLEAIDPHIGFNIEVKWSQKLKDGKMEEEGFEHIVDRNVYLDCILDVVLKKAGNRRVYFSCFDPDICTMLRFKQNRYPVMFLTLGETDKYKKYMDPRCDSIESAVYHAKTMELLGIVAHTEDLLREPNQINLAQSRGLVMFCWGDDNNSKKNIEWLKKLGLHAIIYDKMDQLTSKDVKESVFLLQARESQRDLLKMQALEMSKKNKPPKSPAQSLPCCSPCKTVKS